jgi:hypothetical protein
MDVHRNFARMNWKVGCICLVGLLGFGFVQKPVTTESGTIQGKVCELDGCNPIRGARIEIEIPNSGGMTRTAVSDSAGGFVFSQLPGGRYVLEAEASDFVPVAQMPIIAISEGGRAEDIEIYMRPVGSISGRALDQRGNPLPFAEVDATASQSGISKKVNADSRGEFRIPGLGPDEYIIRIVPPKDAPSTRDYVPTFYPETINRDNAERILMRPGLHIDGIEVKLSSRGIKITGRFITETGRPARASAYLVPRTSSISLANAPSVTEPMKEEFEIRAVPPGSYFLYAVSDFQRDDIQRFNSRVSPQWVRIPIEVGDHNIDGVTVSIEPTGSIHGQIRLAPDAADHGGIDFSELSLHLQPAEAMPPSMAWKPVLDISRDGKFEFAHFSELKCFFSLLSDEWFISQVMFEGRDVTSSGFASAPGEDRVLEVFISNTGGRLTGVLKNTQDRPLPGARVVLLPAQPLSANPSFSKVALADDAGQFRIDAIPPGEYLVIAFPPEDLSSTMSLDNAQWTQRYERYGQLVEISGHVESRIDLVTITP